MFIQRPPPPLLLNVTTGNSIAFTLIKFIYAFSLRSFIVFPLSGELVAGYGNGTSGAALNALTFPWGLAMDNNENLYVADFGNARIMKISTGTLAGSVVAGIGTSGNSINQLEQPTEIAIDKDLNIYINDDFNYRIMLWTKNSSFGNIVAGNGMPGYTNNTIDESIGLAVDSQGNIYVSDKVNHRVMKWTPNATSGTLAAGTGIQGSTNQQLSYPYGLYLDEDNSYLYIADWNNHRIQRYRLGNSTIGTTVAGGNGMGNGSNQLNEPYDVCVSKKTGNIYIADKGNQRIQRCSPGATSGITIIGTTGINTIDDGFLNAPSNVILNNNETYLYVSELDNHRVKRYRLP